MDPIIIMPEGPPTCGGCHTFIQSTMMQPINHKTDLTTDTAGGIVLLLTLGAWLIARKFLW